MSQDYSPFGVTLSGRNFTLAGAEGSRYGFNNKEKDDELKGADNSYDFGARMYDPRIGKWLSIDPLAEKYPNLNPYNFVANNPLQFIDPDGKAIIVPRVLRAIGTRTVQDFIDSQADAASSGFKPGLTIRGGTQIVFESQRDARRAQRFINRNQNSSDRTVMALVVSYTAILTPIGNGSDITIQFGQTTQQNIDGDFEKVQTSGNSVIVDQVAYDKSISGMKRKKVLQRKQNLESKFKMNIMIKLKLV